MVKMGISTLQIVILLKVILQIVEQKRSYLGQMDVNAITFSMGFLRRD
jgi:hypothetical protein